MQQNLIKKLQQVLIHKHLQKKVDLVSLKSEVDKLDINKLKTLPTRFNNLKADVDKLDITKLLNF